MKYFIITVRREDRYETILYKSASLINFMLIEKELGRQPIIIFYQEISEEEFNAFLDHRHFGANV